MLPSAVVTIAMYSSCNDSSRSRFCSRRSASRSPRAASSQASSSSPVRPVGLQTPLIEASTAMEVDVQPQSTGAVAISYPEDGFSAFGQGGGSGFWFEHRAEAVRRKVKCFDISSMWEVGAGTGAMANRLRGTLTDVTTVEPLPSGARASAALGMTSLCGTLQDLRLPDESLESIGVFDVLEHVEHPEPLVEEVHRVLRPAGLVIATVPAFPALWGNEDDAAGHHRRYTKSTLEAEFEARGFASIGTEYLYASLVPPAGVLRAAGRPAARHPCSRHSDPRHHP